MSLDEPVNIRIKYPFRPIQETYMSLATCAISRQSLKTKYPMHWHEFFEVTFVLEGRGLQILNGRRHLLQPGTIFFLTPADFHEIIPAQGVSLEMFNLAFTDEILSEELRHLLFTHPNEYNTVLGADRFAAIEAEFQTLHTELVERKTGYQLIIKGALEHVLIELIRSCQGNRIFEQVSLPGLPYPAIHRALLYMHSYFRKPLTLEDAAQQAQLAPNYFSECFHKATGIAFQSYLQNLRLKFAAGLLIASELPVTDICYASGFNTLSHFTRVFKQKFGQSPNIYRHTEH